MSRKFLFVSVLVILALAVSVTSAGAGSPMGNSFSFQGKIRNAYTGYCDMIFSLWDAASSGTQIGTDITRNRVQTTGGTFSQVLDFGAGAINGDGRWVETEARCPSSPVGAFPNYGRTKLEAAAYAQYALNTGSAVNSDLLDGLHASGFVQAGQANSITSDMLLNGTISFFDWASNGCTSGQIPKWNGSGWECGTDFTGLGGTDADTLDGQHGSYYLNAGNINAGSLGTSFFDAYADLGASGYLGDATGDLARNNGTLQVTLNADLLDGQHGAYFLNASNVNAGALGTSFFDAYADLGAAGYLGDAAGDLARNNGMLQVTLNADLLDGVHNGSLSADLLDGLHAASFLQAGQASSVTTGMVTNGTLLFEDWASNGCNPGQIAKWNGTAWYCAGDNGGSDADTLDGQHGSFYQDAGNINAGILGTAHFNAYANLDLYGYLDNGAGDIPRNNGTWQVTLNADMVDGSHTGSGSGNIPINNGNLNTDLNADLLDGFDSNGFIQAWQANSVDSGMIVNGSVSFGDWASNSCSSGEIPKMTAFGWACGGDIGGTDADTLDGQHGSFYQSADHINSGTLNNLYYSAFNDLGAEGYFGNQANDIPLNNGVTQPTLNADLLDGAHAGTGFGLVADLVDGFHASAFAGASHDHWGQSWTGSGTGLSLSGGTKGLYGYGSNIGVDGRSNYSTGVGVQGDGNTGVSATGIDYGLYAMGNIGVYGYGDNYAIYGQGGTYAGYFNGNVHITGNLTVAGAKNAVVKTKDYGTRALYAVESPGNWFEDFGTGQLVDGIAIIPIEPIFAQTVNLAEGYHVFLTPRCSVFTTMIISASNESSFTVEGITNTGEESQCAFDYRIIAKRLGYESVRLEEFVEPEPPVLPGSSRMPEAPQP
jgi:hypothetical protein